MYSQGGYGGMQGAAAVSPEVQQWFNAVDRDRSGKINAKELQSALVNGQGKNFSDTACSLMIGMFDADKSGTIDVDEFQKLYGYINQWLGVFRTYDRDQSGNIEEAELGQALQQMGFRFSPDFIGFLIKKSDLQNHKSMTVDQFIVQQAVDPDVAVWFYAVDQDGSGQINFEELQCALVLEKGKTFSYKACNMMIKMFDNDKNGTINVQEFVQLYGYIMQWVQIFKRFDRDQSGFINEPELAQGFRDMGYNLSPQMIHFLISKHQDQNRMEISMDEFIIVCIQVQVFTSAFRERDKNMTGVVTLGFEEFLQIALNYSI